MAGSLNRREFLKLAWGAGNYAVWGRHLTPRVPELLGPLRSGADLDLTHFWDGNVYWLTPDRGRVRLSASLFIGKFMSFNYGFQQPGIIPGDVSTLMWNSAEALTVFGSHRLYPGDEIVFVDNVDATDKLTEEEFGVGKHGDGYYRIGNGMCNSATTLGESFGTEIVFPSGEAVPLFIARPGSIQPHNMPHNEAYYNYSYNGEGVAVALTSRDGRLPFAVNPNLPRSLSVDLTTSYGDTDPSNPHAGYYKPTVTVEVAGLPNGFHVRYQRLTANRRTVVERVTGSKQFMTKSGRSNYFDAGGRMIISERPILPPEPFEPDQMVELGSVKEGIFESYFGATKVPESVRNETFFPGGFARPGKHLGPDSVIWSQSDDYLPVAPADLPAPMREISAAELYRILVWNNVGHPKNIRYAATSRFTYCNVGAVDWANAYRIPGYPYPAPLPRWETIRKTKMNTNDLYDWFTFGEAKTVGWQQITAVGAQESANQGLLAFAIARNNMRGPGHMTVIVPGEGMESKGVFYPNVADSGRGYGPEMGKNVFDSFQHTFREGYSGVLYFVWVPPEL